MRVKLTPLNCTNMRGRLTFGFSKVPPPVHPLELYESDWIEGTIARSIVKDTTKDFFVKKKMY